MKIADLSGPNVPAEMVELWKRRWSDGTLLPVQELAFSSSDFWGEKNLVVQAPTSSGKTFIAEVLCARTIATRFYNCIYLVPYRAMVGEKYAQFAKAFGAEEVQYTVYPSSSDYQDYDTAISHGKFDLAVMVYEKLFAMLSESTGPISRCQLLIVDELQMISEQERGGKLEMILTRLLSRAGRGSHTRLVGLSGVGSDLTRVIQWLGACSIVSHERPVPLREGVCTLSGEYTYRSVGLAETDASVKQQEVISLPKPAPQSTYQLALALARYHVNKGDKVLIFTGARRGAYQMATELAKSSQVVELGQETRDHLKQMEHTDAREHLANQLLRRGIAYHHAGLSFEERDLVEAQFSEQTGLLKGVAATETLAVGVNLPADVVILADTQRPAGDGRVGQPPVLKPISVEDYRNCIGRAGRYGISRASEGRSYLLARNAAEANQYWRSYVLGASTDIESALKSGLTNDAFVDGDRLAPFVLNRIAEEGETPERRLIAFFGNSLAYSASLNRLKEFDLPFDESLNILQQLGLAERTGLGWRVTGVGNALAHAAVSIEAYEKIKLLAAEMSRWKEDTFYAGDVLYNLCSCPEIEKLSCLALTKRERLSGHTIQNLWRQPDLALPVVPDQTLHRLVWDPQAPAPRDTARMKRALLLGQWIRGHSPSQIRQLTGLDYVSWGDLRLIGDLTAWMIEGAADVAQVDERTRPMVGPLRKLVGQVKYGVPADAVYVAKLHVRALHRGHMTRLATVKPAGQTWDDFILAAEHLPLPGDVAERLRDAIVDRNTKDTREGRGAHLRRISQLIAAGDAEPEWRKLVNSLYSAQGLEFEARIHEALSRNPIRLNCYRPCSHRSAEPDLIIEVDGVCAIGECKRMQNEGKRVSWNDARQILTANRDSLPQVVNCFVIGYDGFDELAVQANSTQDSPALLLPLDAFVEACLWVIETSDTHALWSFLTQARGHYRRWEINLALMQHAGVA